MTETRSLLLVPGDIVTLKGSRRLFQVIAWNYSQDDPESKMGIRAVPFWRGVDRSEEPSPNKVVVHPLKDLVPRALRGKVDPTSGDDVVCLQGALGIGSRPWPLLYRKEVWFFGSHGEYITMGDLSDFKPRDVFRVPHETFRPFHAEDVVFVRLGVHEGLRGRILRIDRGVLIQDLDAQAAKHLVMPGDIEHVPAGPAFFSHSEMIMDPGPVIEFEHAESHLHGR